MVQLRVEGREASRLLLQPEDDLIDERNWQAWDEREVAGIHRVWTEPPSPKPVQSSQKLARENKCRNLSSLICPVSVGSLLLETVGVLLFSSPVECNSIQILRVLTTVMERFSTRETLAPA